MQWKFEYNWRALLTFCCLLFYANANTQNLLANGNFKDRNTCVEFRAPCAPEAWFFVPAYIVTSPSDGNNNYEVISIGSLKSGARSGNYIYSKILCPLVTRQRYELSVCIRTPSNDFDHLDVWMGPQEPGSRLSPFDIDKPTFTITREHFRSDTGTWKRYTLEFVADGTERFLLLGNFSNVPLDKAKVISGNRSGHVLYHLDNISLYPVAGGQPGCPEYKAVAKQLYEQDFRHPAHMIEESSVDTSLIDRKFETPVKQVTWVIVDTPPAFKTRQPDTLVVPDVLFEFNSSNIRSNLVQTLDSFAAIINSKVFKTIDITGYTDDVGATNYNVQLSYRRALAVRTYLGKRLIVSSTSIKVNGAGEKQPVASNRTVEGRNKNRRVEIVIQR